MVDLKANKIMLIKKMLNLLPPNSWINIIISSLLNNKGNSLVSLIIKYNTNNTVIIIRCRICKLETINKV